MHTEHRRCPVLRLILPLIAGYVAAEHLWPGLFRPFLVLGILLTALSITLAYGPWGREGLKGLCSRTGEAAWIGVFSAAVFCLATAYYQHRKNDLPEWDRLPPRETELEFQVERLFASSRADHLSGIGRVTRPPPLLEELAGKRIHFSFGADPEMPVPTRTTRLRSRGVLEPLGGSPTGDGFQRFLARSGIQFRFARGPPPEKARPARTFFRSCRNLRDEFAARLQTGAPEDAEYVAVYVAMLLGQRQALSDKQRSVFMGTGTLHLFAISGLHIGVIALALKTVLNVMRVPPRPTAAIGLALLLLYVEITGGAPSAVRAFIMVAFFWSASVFARPGNPVSALACSAVCVLLLFPYQLWNAGFQLSYTVVTSILLLGLPLARHWQECWQPFGWLPRDDQDTIRRNLESGRRFFLGSLAVSLTATLASTPLGVYYFNVFAPGAVVLNVVLVSLAAVVISAGMMALFFGLFGLTVLTVLFNHAAWMVILVMEIAVALWWHLPLHFWSAEYRHDLFAGLATGAVLIGLLLYAEYAGRIRRINAFLPFLALGALLAIGARLTFPG